MIQNNTINYYGFNFPLFGGHQNVLSRQSGDRIIKNDIRQLFLTRRGERRMRSEFGSALMETIFEQGFDSANISAIQSDLQSLLDRYENRVDASVIVQYVEEDRALHIYVNGTFTDQPNTKFEDEILVKVTPVNATSNQP